MKSMKSILAVSAAMVMATGASYGQAGTGSLAGTVTDSTNAPIPGATVTLTNPSIGYSKTVTANGQGGFTFFPLTVAPGYILRASVAGFKTGEIKDITTSVGTVVAENFTLTAGGATETVEVEAGSTEQVQTDTSAVSNLIDRTVFQDSPLSVRNQNTFVGLTAGAVGDGGTGRGFSVNGARTGTGNFMLEGFDNNDQGLGGGASGGAVVRISPDAIEEYRVISSVSNAEYGRAGGFTTDTVLKSGTNKLHGSAFEYNRIQALAQNSWFSKNSGLRDHLVRNQYGGSIGGPIYKDRTFFYATAEFQNQSQGSPSSFTGITQDFYNFVKSGAYEQFMEGTGPYTTSIQNPNGDGTVSGGFCLQYLGASCPGKFASVATLGPVFTKNYAATPNEFPFGTSNLTNEPTDLLLGGTTYLPVNIYGTGNVISSDVYKQHRGTLKIDHRLDNRDQLSFAYSLDLDNDTYNNGGGGAFPGPALNDYGGAQIFGATWTHTFTPNLLNQFRAGYLRHVRNFATTGPQGVAETVSADTIGTGFGAGSGFPQLFTENQFTYEDAVTLTKSTHQYKAGFRFARTRNGSSFYNDVNGTYYYWGAADMLTDAKNTLAGEAADPGDFPISAYGGLYYASASLDPTTNSAPNPYRGYRANEFAAYVQDDWKASARLTLNYGLRWDYFGPPHNAVPGIDSNVYFGSDTTLKSTLNKYAPNTPLLLGEQGATFQYAQSNGRSTIWNRDLNNVAPRFGFAYDTFGNGRLVIRGGYGIGFDRLYNNVYENIRFNAPRFVDNTGGFGAGLAGISAANTAGIVQSPFVGNALLAGTGASVPRHVNQNLKTAYYEQYHFGFETHAGGYVFETNYIGTLGRQLVGLMNANTFEGRVACQSSSPTAQKALCAAAGTPTLSTTRPSLAFANDNFRTNGFSSNFNGGQVSVRKGYSNGMQLLANYSYGKTLDQISDVFTIKGGGTGIPTPYNPSANYGPADFDVRHSSSITLNYTTRSQNHKLLLAGWGISPIVSMHSGTPINVYNSNSSYDPNKDGTTGVERALYIGTGTPSSHLNHSGSPAGLSGGPAIISLSNYKNNLPGQTFTCPTNVNGGLFCDVGGRNALYGLRGYNVDAAVSKHIALGERFKLTLQAAFFDIDGHVEWGNPVGDVNSSNFGKSTGASGREGQLSGRVDF